MGANEKREAAYHPMNWRDELGKEAEKPTDTRFVWKMGARQKELVRIAATRRDLSMLAYARRSLMSFVAHDLGLDYYDLMDDERISDAATKRGGNIRWKLTPTNFPQGTGHGEWVIKELST